MGKCIKSFSNTAFLTKDYRLGLWCFMPLKHYFSYIVVGRNREKTTDLSQVTSQTLWFSPGSPVSSINKTERHDITEILLKVALNTITLNPKPQLRLQTFKSF